MITCIVPNFIPRSRDGFVAHHLFFTIDQYIRVAHDTPESDILHLLTDIWNLPLPKLIIEVTGGAKDFVLQPKLRRVFRKGIVKVAESTDAWILTGGTNTGKAGTSAL